MYQLKTNIGEYHNCCCIDFSWFYLESNVTHNHISCEWTECRSPSWWSFTL